MHALFERYASKSGVDWRYLEFTFCSIYLYRVLRLGNKFCRFQVDALILFLCAMSARFVHLCLMEMFANTESCNKLWLNVSLLCQNILLLHLYSCTYAHISHFEFPQCTLCHIVSTLLSVSDHSQRY
jgi:hypothetical protein